MKRYAKPGEYIKIVKVYPGYENDYHNGDIFQVKGKRNGFVNAKGGNVLIAPHEYVVLEGYRP